MQEPCEHEEQERSKKASRKGIPAAPGESSDGTGTHLGTPHTTAHRGLALLATEPGRWMAGETLFLGRAGREREQDAFCRMLIMVPSVVNETFFFLGVRRFRERFCSFRTYSRRTYPRRWPACAWWGSSPTSACSFRRRRANGGTPAVEGMPALQLLGRAQHGQPCNTMHVGQPCMCKVCMRRGVAQLGLAHKGLVQIDLAHRP